MPTTRTRFSLLSIAFSWQFYRQEQAFVSGRSASVPFAAPSVGRWRVNATYGGSRTASPSAVGFSYLLVS
jgi:hypothetical protein